MKISTKSSNLAKPTIHQKVSSPPISRQLLSIVCFKSCATCFIQLTYCHPEHEMHGARSEAGTVIEERHEVFTVPAPPAPMAHFPPPPPPAPVQIIEDTKIVEHHGPPQHHHEPPVIIDARPHEETTFVERTRDVYERSNPVPVGPMALALSPHNHRANERDIRAEIKALEAEKEALRAEKRAEREMRKADRIRREGREGDMVLYERDRYETANEDVTIVRRERVEESDGGVRIEKDKKGRMSISVPKYYR